MHENNLRLTEYVLKNKHRLSFMKFQDKKLEKLILKHEGDLEYFGRHPELVLLTWIEIVKVLSTQKRAMRFSEYCKGVFNIDNNRIDNAEKLNLKRRDKNA